MELQNNNPELKSRACSAPIVDVAFRPNANAERYRNSGGPFSMFDTSAQPTMNCQFCGQQTLTHHYQKTPNKLYHINNIDVSKRVKLHEYDLEFNTIIISPEKETKKDNPDTTSKDYESIRNILKSNENKK